MAGSSRRCRGGRAPAGPSLPAPGTVNPREVAVATSSTLYEPHVWADLLETMLHQIIALLSSFHDFLAFATTCHSWCAAASSFPSMYASTFPPLHLKPDVGYTRPRPGRVMCILLSKCKWQLVDPAKTTFSPRCSVPQNAPNSARYLGSSYGHLIFSNQTHGLIVNAYTGTKVKTLKLRSGDNFENYYYGILTAPLNSPNSLLLLCSDTSMIHWGTYAWVECPFAFGGTRILQIVSFKGQIFAIDFLQRLHTIRLLPQLDVQEVATVWGEDMVVGLHFKPWLVVCGDMLIMVELSVCTDQLYGIYGKFQVFRLDFTVEPAEWVGMEKMDNWALFISFDSRNPTFSCMSPERWGGKSSCIYVARPLEGSEEPWSMIEIGQPVPSTTNSVSCSLASPPGDDGHYSQLENLWVLPSLVHGFGHP